MKSKATELSAELWGGVLHSDNRGFYTSLEFFALVAGMGEEDARSPERWEDLSQLTFRIPGHILARCFAFDPDEIHDERLVRHMDEELIPVVRAIIRELKVQIPGAGKAGQSWHGSHFVPYGKNLTHWDARFRRNRAHIERIYFRGAGTLALAILLADPDRHRARASIQHLRHLLGHEHFTGHLLGLFHELEAPEHDMVPFSSSRKGPEPHIASMDATLLASSRLKHDQWEELLRATVRNVLEHPEAPGVVKLDALYHIIPLVMALMQVGRSSRYLAQGEIDFGQSDPLPVVVDCSPPDTGTNEVRQAAHRSFSRAQQHVIQSIKTMARRTELSLSSNQVTQFRSYFTRGAPAIGLLNAATGIRRFVLKTGLLEALVLAMGAGEMTYESFLENWLLDNFGMVIDARAARQHGFDSRADLSIFEDNARHLASTLDELGLMQSYSDATRMVRYGF